MGSTLGRLSVTMPTLSLLSTRTLSKEPADEEADRTAARREDLADSVAVARRIIIIFIALCPFGDLLRRTKTRGARQSCVFGDTQGQAGNGMVSSWTAVQRERERQTSSRSLDVQPTAFKFSKIETTKLVLSAFQI